MYGKTILATLVGATLLVGGALPSIADDCEKRVRKAEQNLRREIDRHGEHGKDVGRFKRDLERERENCRRVEKERHTPPPETSQIGPKGAK
jgi:hypothetical protein